jgi:hypothetical protein
MRWILVLALTSAAVGCGGSSVAPASNALTINAMTPAAGATVVIPAQYQFFMPGGVVLPPGSGLLSVNVTMTVGHDVPWAQLNVYLLTGGTSDQYCGQNINDSPTWQFLTSGWMTTVNVTGFRIYQLPCDVTGFRAMLHMRNNGNLTPPSASETIAEATMPTRLRLER